MLKCCEKCLEHIARMNTRSASLWVDLCDDITALTYFSCDCDIHDFFRTLEHESYIVTTECNHDYLAVKLNGVDLYSKSVCIKPDIHY